MSAHKIMIGRFCNVPSGAFRDAGELGSSDDLVAFWREGRTLLRATLASARMKPAGYSEKAERIHGDL